jgi:hypothetical protein
MSSYRNVYVKGTKIFLPHEQAISVEQVLEENKELRERVEKLTLPRVSGTPIDQPVATEVAQVISYLRFWQDNPAPLRTFRDEELSQFFEKIAQQLDDHERASTVIASNQDDGEEPEDPDNWSSVRELGGYATWINENPARLPRVWPFLCRCIKEVQGRYEDQSETESARTSVERNRPRLIGPEDGPKGKEVVRLPRPEQQQVQPVRLPTPKPTAAPTPAADEDVEVIDVEQEPLGGLGKRKPADEPYHEDDTRERKERPALPTIAEAYAATRRDDTTPADELLLREVTRADPHHATVTRRVGVRIPDSDFEPEDDGTVKASDLSHEEIVSDTETLADASVDAQIRRQQRKKISVWKKIGPRYPNKKEEEKLAGYDTEVRRLRILKAQAAGVSQEKIPTVLYLWGQQDRERISRKEKQQLKDLLS